MVEEAPARVQVCVMQGPGKSSGALLEPPEVFRQRTLEYLKQLLDKESLRDVVGGCLPTLKALKAFLYMSTITTILSNIAIPNMDVDYKLQNRFN
jgi:hypothetical protein